MEHERGISNDSVQATNAHVIYAIDKPMASAGALAGGEVLISQQTSLMEMTSIRLSLWALMNNSGNIRKSFEWRGSLQTNIFYSEKTSTHKRNKLLILLLARQCNKRFAESFQISGT